MIERRDSLIDDRQANVGIVRAFHKSLNESPDRMIDPDLSVFDGRGRSANDAQGPREFSLITHVLGFSDLILQDKVEDKVRNYSYPTMCFSLKLSVS